MTNKVDEHGPGNSQNKSRSACPDPNMLGAYLDDTLSEEKKRFVDTHIEMCQECRLAVQVGKRDQQKHEDLVLSQTPDNTLDQLCNQLVPFSQFSPGKTIGRYITVKPLGLGGMSEVYSAYDPELDRRIALKLMRTDVYADSRIESNVTRLMKEAKAMAQLSHPNVISVYDVMKVDGQVVIAMEYISGGTLRSWLQAKPRSWQEIVEKFVLAGQGLAAAHAAKLVHRDFKPANVLVEKDGQVCVTDFGLVRGLDQEEDPNPTKFPAFNIRWDESLTKTGAYIGTPAYMSPEQLLGEKSDTRSDQFCFCVALFESLYEQRPFMGETAEELKESVLSGEIAPVDKSKEVPERLYDIIKQGLEVNPEDRYPSMEDLLEQLRHDPEEEVRKKRVLRNRRLGWIAVILLSVVLPVGVWYGMRYRTVQLCKASEEEFTGIWDNTTKPSVKGAFLATGKPYAQETWKRIEKAFDKYLTDWSLMRGKICEAKHIQGTESEELFDLRMTCLKDRKQELQALSKVFAIADSGVLKKAIQASLSLTGIDNCADEKALRAPYPPPKSIELKRRVDSIRERLAEVKALIKIGKYKQGLKLAQMLVKEARAVDYQPVQAQAMYWLANMLERAGKYKESETTLREAARLAGESRDGLLLVKTMTDLMWVVRRQGRYEEALTTGRNAELMLSASGGDNLVRAKLLTHIGIVLQNQGEFDEALEYYQKSLAMRVKTLGPEHHNVTGSLLNIGSVFRSKGEYDKALEYYQKSLTIQEKTLGPEHPAVADSLLNIGTVFHNLGQHDKALKYYQKSLTIYEKTLGPQHPAVALALNNIGVLFRDWGEYDKALEYYQKSMAIREKSLGPQHDDVAGSLQNISIVLYNQGKFDKALESFQKSLAIRAKTLGPEHHKVALLLNDIGVVFKDKGEYKKALEYHQNALPILENKLGPKHPDVALTLYSIGDVLVAQKNERQAIEALERSIAICERKTCDQEIQGKGLFVLARTLLKAAGDKTSSPKSVSRERAIKMGQQAREVFKKAPKRFKKELKLVDTWLKKNGVSESKPTTAQ